MGEMTAAVPQAPASSKVESSSSGICRHSTLSPISRAMVWRELLVMDGRIDVDFGVT